MKKIMSLVLAVFMSVGVFAGCGGNNNDSTELEPDAVNVTLTERGRYNNMFTEEYIPDQWENYGIGDPYVLRYNGEYYLYGSTKSPNSGYKVWKSLDLIHWEYLGKPEIFAQDGVTTTGHTNAYAPEVHHWNGDFYMYASPAGVGHTIYKSVDGTPYGNFRAVTGNIGLKIDGSVFIDDDEKMYFHSAREGGIRAYEMASMESVTASTEKTLNTPMTYWTEGSTIIKRDGIYYITYTGNQVKSLGYRVDYSYAFDSPVSSNYVYPVNNSLILSTLNGHHGLGHSGVVLGPDMDSYYKVYHNLKTEAPHREYNIDRIEFSGTRMNVWGPTKSGAMTPYMPEFFVKDDGTSYAEDRTDALEESGGAMLSSAKTGKDFSAEYNFKGITADGSFKATFGEKDGGYYYVTINGKEVLLKKVSGETDTQVAKGTLVNDFDWTKLHTLRVTYKEGRAGVYFDDMNKIDTELSGAGGGKIGYRGYTGATIGTTAFSNFSFGSSDNAEAAVVEGDMFAPNFMLDEGLSKLTAENPVYDVEKDENDYRDIYSDARSLVMNEGDYVTYAIDVLEDGLYGIEAMFNVANAGAEISLQVGNEKPVKIALPEANFGDNFYDEDAKFKFAKRTLTEIALKKGLHTLRVKVLKGNFDVIMYNFFRSSESVPKFEHDLSSYVTSGANYMTLWKVQDGAHYSKRGINNLVMFGKTTMTDYTVSVDIKIASNVNNASAGIIVRANNPSLFGTLQPVEGAEGYLISLNNMQVSLARINYGGDNMAVEPFDTEIGKYYNLKVVVKDNKISVYVDDVFMFSYADPYPFAHGAVAFYSISSESYYKNLVITNA